MRVIETIRGLKAALGGAETGLVPTMGALHEGHGALIDRARRENRVVAVSVFVNPTQFDRASDLQSYPRALEADAAFCEARGADIVFAPAAAEMYPEPQSVFVDPGPAAGHLCGKFRPGHFRGVATVVLKLFQIVAPRRAYFGEKDAQQLAVILRMSAQLNLRTEVLGVPTVREADGLAMSSRNRLLSPEDRAAAPVLYQALRSAARAVEGGERDAAAVKEAGLTVLARASKFRVEYFEAVEPAEMQPVTQIAGPVRIAAAAFLEAVRLIDNVLAVPPSDIIRS